MRMTEDWDNVNLNEITFYTLVPRKLQVIRDIIKMWDNRFPVKYFQYRSQIKDIALKQWPLSYITKLPQEIEDDDWFVPSDDDDWLHHDLSKFLEKQNEEYVYWNPLVNMTFGKYGRHRWFPLHTKIGSNGYAIKGSLLNRANENQRHILIHSHSCSIKVAKSLDAEIGEHRNKVMSCYNNHPGSISSLHGLVEKCGMIKGAIPAGEPRKGHPKWLEPSYNELLRVIDKLKDKISLL